MVACSYSGADTPDHNQFCFSSAQCAAILGVDLKGNPKPTPGLFQTGANQAHDCPFPLSYCYPDPANGQSLKLSVPFDPAKPTVIDLSDYINQAYTWMIAAGMTIAIVMMMIGGLQYVLAAGGGSVDKGKKRIMNGIIGFVLLLCVNLILQTVNPYLTKLQVPSLPLIKQIGLPTGSSCEDMAIAKDSLKKQIYTLCPAPKGSLDPDPTTGKYVGPERCGTQDAQVSGAAGQSGVAGGSSCTWQTCDNPGEVCVNKKCVLCEDVYSGSPNGLKPSQSVCGQLTPPAPKIKNSVQVQCVFLQPPNITSVALSSLLNGAVGSLIQSDNPSSCGALAIHCAEIHSCDDYNSNVYLRGQIGNSDSISSLGLTSGTGPVPLYVKNASGFANACGSNVCSSSTNPIPNCEFSNTTGKCQAQGTDAENAAKAAADPSTINHYGH